MVVYGVLLGFGGVIESWEVEDWLDVVGHVGWLGLGVGMLLLMMMVLLLVSFEAGDAGDDDDGFTVGIV